MALEAEKDELEIEVATELRNNAQLVTSSWFFLNISLFFIE
jgi:hypothetical protein